MMKAFLNIRSRYAETWRTRWIPSLRSFNSNSYRVHRWSMIAARIWLHNSESVSSYFKSPFNDFSNGSTIYIIVVGSPRIAWNCLDCCYTGILKKHQNYVHIMMLWFDLINQNFPIMSQQCEILGWMYIASIWSASSNHSMKWIVPPKYRSVALLDQKSPAVWWNIPQSHLYINHIFIITPVTEQS